MRITSRRIRQLCCAACLGLSALPMLRADFLFSDDYYWFDIQHSRPWDAGWENQMMTVMNGRPLHGLLFGASFPWLADRGSWVGLRLVGCALLALTAWAIARPLRRVWDERTSDWVATAVVALPGFTLFSFWLIGMPCIPAALAGALGASLALGSSWRHRLLGGLALVLGLASYQPFALVYFALLGLVATGGELAFAAFAVGLIAIGAYFVLARLCIALFEYDIAARGALVFLPVEKARWLLESALPFSARLWSVALPAWVGLVALGVLLGWTGWRLRHELPRLWQRTLFVLACAAMTVLPHLSVRETVSRWRTLLPLSVLVALLVFAALEVKRWPRGVLVGGVLALLALHAYELERYGVRPERAMVLQAAAELRRLHASQGGPTPAAPLPTREREETSASALTAAAIPSVFALRASGHEAACAPQLSDDEFTAPSSQHDFAVAGIIRLASELERLPMPYVTHGTDAKLAHDPIVDLRTVPPEICARAR